MRRKTRGEEGRERRGGANEIIVGGGLGEECFDDEVDSPCDGSG